jgi:Ca-activated chloride channel family protein
VYVRLDEETLKSVADVTRAEYFYAGTSSDLRKVYRDLNSKLVLERKNVEVTSLMSMAAALLVLLALGLSLWWSSRNLR